MKHSNKEPRVFISYRRADASAHAGRLFDWLGRQFGSSRVFIDTDKIQAGAEFPQTIADNLAQSDIVLALIGRQWLSITDENGRRLDNPQDFVRREIETALIEGKRVVPVLVQGAEMPKADDLPAGLKDLAWRNAVAIGDATFERDFDVLVDDILGRPRGFMRRELDRLQRIMLVAKRSTILVPILAILFVFAVWMKVFDIFNLDTLTTNYLLWAVETISGPPPESNVLLVTIDAQSEAKLGHRFSADNRAAWREFHSQLIDRAARADAEAVVFDIHFESESAADDTLANAVSRAITAPFDTRSVFGIVDYQEGTPKLVSKLLDAGAGWGTLCLVPHMSHLYAAPLAVVETDDALDSGPIVRAHIPALSVSAIRPEKVTSIDVSRRLLGFHGDPLPDPLRFSAIEHVFYDEGECNTLAAGDDYAMLIIRNRAPDYWLDSSRRISYADLLETGSIGDERLRGRILLVGITELSEGNDVSDQHVVYRGFSRSLIYGVEFHASAITDLQTGRIFSTPTVDWQAFIIAVMAVLGAATSLFTATHARLTRRLTLMSILVLYIAIAIAFAIGGILLNVLYDLVAFLIAHGILLWLQRRSHQVTKGSWNDE